eukprot:CAMPEP_0119271716 /NCGR_PEP_ID=MMETSP1329-20130426/8194_1 /TAXON_ID=114041 /ORGANISM="Genus nov. species nov., Strain RCC1024" /LENGTH=417 /DNA_ID=CAMNT_0007271767 /DNA_START=55 /DNA_END=1308 /DNA_ORIENTATION=-
MAPTFDFESLFGPALLTRTAGEQPTAAVLKDKKVVGIYFSAHYYPQSFTTALGQWYEAQKDKDPSFEIVFVSSDKDDASFQSYYGEQASWAALPFANRAAGKALSKKFKVRQFQPFVLVDGATGELITADGYEGVSSDPEGFPWRPKSLGEVISGLELQDKSKAAVPVPSGPLLLYFSAHWCPPCRGFTPELVKFFDELKACHAGANIAFVSSDKDQVAFDEYFGEMGASWLAVPFAPFADRGAKDQLSKLFGVQGIPALVLLSAADADGNRTTVTTAGRDCVAEGLVKDFPESWAFGDLAKTKESKGKSVDDARALCLFADGLDDADAAEAVASLKALAADEAASETLFFYCTSPAGLAAQVKKLCGLKDTAEAALVLLDFPDDNGYYVKEGAGTDRASLEAFLKEPGERKQLASA